VSDDLTTGHARVLHCDAYDLRHLDQHQGNTIEGSHAQDSARVHNGNHYGPVNVNNYNYPPSGGSMPDTHQSSSKDPGQKQSPNSSQDNNSQNDIALAMETLSFARMDNRQANIRKAYGTTCRWILDKPEYIRWRNADLTPEHNGFFWIKSKPGAGKSTLMKFFVGSAAKQLPNDHVISFFFNARGESLERSLEGLYRGLLHQLLTAVPRLQEVINAQEMLNLSHQAWPLDRLKTIFSEAVAELGQDRVTCFIDALDECPDSEIRDMIEFFEELGESTAEEDIGLRVCFSSRHYPQITMKKCLPMVLDGQEGHENDIAKYVQSKLKVRGKTAEEVRAAVQGKAKGIFMWVVLVVRILNEESDRGSNSTKLGKCLDRIPAELHDLFQDILQRGIKDNKYLVPILQWISFAQRPLSREELYFAVHSGDADFSPSQPWDPVEDDAEAMDLFILDSSKGLAETTKGKTPTIQFIHESVRDYLRDTGFAALAPELSGNLLGLIHDDLKQCCSIHVTEEVLARLALPETLSKAKSEEAKRLRKQASELFPFLDYATKNLVFHAESALDHGVNQEDFAAALPPFVWKTLTNLFAIHDTRRYDQNPSIARIFLHIGAAQLLKLAYDETFKDLLPRELKSSLQMAIRSKNSELVTAIIKKGPFTSLKPKDTTDLLLQAFRSHDMAIFTALLNDDTSFPTDAEHFADLLHEMHQDANVEAIRYLPALRKRVSDHGPLAMYWAIRHGTNEVVNLLVDLGVTLKSCLSISHEHPVATASRLNREEIVRILLASRNFTMEPDAMGTSLELACGQGSDNLVRVLLDYGAPVNSLHLPGRSPLVAACRQGHVSIVQLLLGKGADANFETLAETPLAVACSLNSFGYISIVKALLESGADPNPLDIPTPLSVAFCRMSESLGDHRPAKILGRTLMYGASITNKAGLLGLLFEYGADANAEGGQDYHDALLDSCLHGHEEVVKVLLANGTGVTCKDDEYYRKVVEEATKNRRGQVVELVLTEGGEFRSRSRDLYTGSLQIALDEGYDEIATFLMDIGVETSRETEGSNISLGEIPPSQSG